MDNRLQNILENLPGGISNNKVFKEYQKNLIEDNLKEYDITMSQNYFNKINLLFPNDYYNITIDHSFDTDFIQIKNKITNYNKQFFPQMLIYNCINKKGEVSSNLSLTNIDKQYEQNINIIQRKDTINMIYQTKNRSLKHSDNMEYIDLTFDYNGNIINTNNDIELSNQTLFKNLFGNKSSSIEYLMDNNKLNNSKILENLCFTEFSRTLSKSLSINLPSSILPQRFRLLNSIEIINLEQELELYIRKHSFIVNHDIIQEIINKLLLIANLDSYIIFQKCFIDLLFSNNLSALHGLDFFAFLIQKDTVYYIKIDINNEIDLIATKVPNALLKCIYQADSYNHDEIIKTFIN